MPVARLSIVIPVLGKLKKLEDTLVSVLENRPAHCEIIVVLNEPYDDPYELAGEVCFIEAPSARRIGRLLEFGRRRQPRFDYSYAGLRNRGHSRLDGRGLAAFRTPRSRRRNAAGHRSGQSRTNALDRRGLSSRRSGMAIGLSSIARRFASHLPAYFGPDLIAGFYRKSALEAVGGLCPEFPGHLAGVDLALALHFADQQCVIEPNCRIVADRPDLPEGERLGGGCQAERLFWRWARRMGWFRAGVGHAALIHQRMLGKHRPPDNAVAAFRPGLGIDAGSLPWSKRTRTGDNRHRLKIRSSPARTSCRRSNRIARWKLARHLDSETRDWAAS